MQGEAFEMALSKQEVIENLKLLEMLCMLDGPRISQN